jgi:hypothetical protein
MTDQLIEKEEQGKKISPVLPAHIKNYLIDIDGTICEDIPNENPNGWARQNHLQMPASPLTIGIEKVTSLPFLHHVPKHTAALQRNGCRNMTSAIMAY